MQNYPECAAVYWEMVGLYKDLFVRYYLDKSADTLYQFCFGVSTYALQKGNPEWTEYKEKRIPENAERIERLVAERTEDDWNTSFWQRHESDISDASYGMTKNMMQTSTEQNWLANWFQEAAFPFPKASTQCLILYMLALRTTKVR